MRLRTFGLLAAVAGTGCAKPANVPAASAAVTQASTAPSRSRDIISKDELTAPSISSLSVLEAVRTLRPHFLTVRGQNTIPAKSGNDPIGGAQIVDQESGKAHASIDGNKVVGLEELAGIRAGTVVEVRFLSVSAAMQRFGGAARQGPVILVTTM